MEFKHEPVLYKECIENLMIKKNGIYVDGTLGMGGHSEGILISLENTGKLIGLDRDKDALFAATKRLGAYTNFFAIHTNHADIKEAIHSIDLEQVDGILLDLGVSSYQLDEPSRGFSYMNDAKLDMRMNREDDLSAFYVVNKYSEERLVTIFKEYGEERYSKRIAANICRVRATKEIDTTLELVQIIREAIPASALREPQHPAKRVFQAIRIEVNQELEKLKQTIIDCVSCLSKHGRLCVITFHSLEDRIVKRTYEQLQGVCVCPKSLPVCGCNVVSHGSIVNKKPIISTSEELDKNPRARSAKLRVFEKI